MGVSVWAARCSADLPHCGFRSRCHARSCVSRPHCIPRDQRTREDRHPQAGADELQNNWASPEGARGTCIPSLTCVCPLPWEQSRVSTHALRRNLLGSHPHLPQASTFLFSLGPHIAVRIYRIAAFVHAAAHGPASPGRILSRALNELVRTAVHRSARTS